MAANSLSIRTSSSPTPTPTPKPKTTNGDAPPPINTALGGAATDSVDSRGKSSQCLSHSHRLAACDGRGLTDERTRSEELLYLDAWCPSSYADNRYHDHPSYTCDAQKGTRQVDPKRYRNDGHFEE